MRLIGEEPRGRPERMTVLVPRFKGDRLEFGLK